MEKSLAEVAHKNAAGVRKAWEAAVKKMGWDGKDHRVRLDTVGWKGETP